MIMNDDDNDNNHEILVIGPFIVYFEGWTAHVVTKRR